MNSPKDEVAVVTDAIYVILGASGNTGSIIADSLLSKGEKVRVIGRDAGRLQRFVRKGAEAFTAEHERCGCAHQSLQRCARGIPDVAPGEIPGGPGARERFDRESREGVRPALRGALEQLWRAGSGRHGASRGAAFFGAKTERDQRFERSAPASRVFHGEQSGGDRHDSWDGNVRKCAATRPEAADDRDARRRRLRFAAPPAPGFFW